MHTHTHHTHTARARTHKHTRCTRGRRAEYNVINSSKAKTEDLEALLETTHLSIITYILNPRP